MGSSRKRAILHLTAGPNVTCLMQHSMADQADINPRSDSRRGRFSNACHRCKSKKLRCHFVGESRDQCRACQRTNSECVFDVSPDKVPRGGAYIASLESEIAALRRELQQARSQPAARQGSTDRGREDAQQTPSSHGFDACARSDGRGSNFGFSELVSNCMFNKSAASNSSPSEITPFNMLQAAPSTLPIEPPKVAPSVPSDPVADQLIEAAYLYTQARYCIVDWVQVREWHQHRHIICGAGRRDSIQQQTGAFFLWMVYAIGAQFASTSGYPAKSYFARAYEHLPVVLSMQDMTALQALLTLVQYSFRAQGGPSVWQLSGIALRLSIELGYHRSATISRGSEGAYHVELRKRFFWCAYSFDRAISSISKRPFGIADADIDVEHPLELDLTTTDDGQIRNLMGRSTPRGGDQLSGRPTTEMSSVLHQLRLDRVRSRIMTRFMVPGALPPSPDEIWSLLAELDHWKEQAPQKLPAPFPQHSTERVHATWLMVALLLLRPVLSQEVVDQDLLIHCAVLSEDACKNAKTLSLSPQTYTSPIQVYHCFNCGISLLQCLALDSTVLSPRRIGRAIVACSSALAIYTRNLGTTSVFLEVFERLSDNFLGEDASPERRTNPDTSIWSILQDITRSPPAEMFRILQSLAREDKQTSNDPGHDQPQSPSMQIEEMPQFMDFAAIGSDVFPTIETGDLTEPFEMFYDMALFGDYDTQVLPDNGGL